MKQVSDNNIEDGSFTSNEVWRVRFDLISDFHSMNESGLWSVCKRMAASDGKIMYCLPQV